MGALHIQKGFEAQDDHYMHADYLEVPVVVRAELPLRLPVAPFLVTGWAPAREVSCGGLAVLAFPGGTPPDPVPLECSHFRQRLLDVGWVAGAGVAVRFGRWALALQARTTRGVRDLTPEYETIDTRNCMDSYLLTAMWRAP